MYLGSDQQRLDFITKVGHLPTALSLFCANSSSSGSLSLSLPLSSASGLAYFAERPVPADRRVTTEGSMSVIRECGLSDAEDLPGNVDANGYTIQKQLLDNTNAPLTPTKHVELNQV